MNDCPQCPHPESDHGTYGCLHGWERARYTETIIQGCKCVRRRLIDHTRSLPTFGLPYPKETSG